jgi:hypothetical protein
MGYFVGVSVSVLFCSIDFIVRNIIIIDVGWSLIEWLLWVEQELNDMN